MSQQKILLLPEDLDPNGFKVKHNQNQELFSKREIVQIFECYNIVKNWEHRKSFNTKHSSYVLKHIFERYLREIGSIDYVCNGALIVAMILAGFNYKKYAPNCVFNVKKTDIKRIIFKI